MADFNTFIEAIQKEDLEKVKILFRKEFINQRYEGWTGLHWASYYNNKGDIVKYLVREGCNIEDEIRGVLGVGWRCIHMAVWRGKVEVLKTLIKAGCDLDSLTKEGETPSSVALGEGRKEFEEIIKRAKEKKRDAEYKSLLKKNSLSKIMNIQSGKTFLDDLLNKEDSKILEAIKSKPVDYQEIDEWKNLDLKTIDPKSYKLLHECMLARCLYQRYEDGVYALCTTELANKKSLFMGPTALESALECGVTIYSVRNILWKLINEDESWRRAEEIAKRNNQSGYLSLISERREYLNEEKQSLSRLHVAVIENDPGTISFILDNDIIDADEGHQKNGTALSLSYSLNHTKCTDVFQKNKVNVNTVDKFKQSPLHMAIYNRKDNKTDYLVENITNIESQDFMNFTVLERSVMNDCKNICERLVEKGARCDKYVTIDAKLLERVSDLSMILYRLPHLPLSISETIFTLCFKVNKTVYPGLLDTLDVHTIDLIDGNGNSLLHLCAMSLNSDICKELILRSANVHLINESKHTPLFELLIKNYEQNMNEIRRDMIESVKVLIDGGASVNVEDGNKCNILEVATNYKNEELLLALIHKREPIVNIKKSEWSTWLNMKHFTFIKEVISLLDELLLRDWITEDHIKRCLENEDVTLSKIIFDKAKVEEQRNVVEVMIQKFATVGDEKLFKEMIEHDLSFNSLNDEAESLLNGLIKNRNEKFIELALRSKNGEMLLEKEGIDKKLPLHVCIECDYWDIIDQLIVETKSVDSEDNDGNTPLSLLLIKMSEMEDERMINRLMTSAKNLILKSANIYKVNKLNKAVITYCTKSHLKLRIEEFFRKHRDIKTAPSKETKQEQQCGAASILVCPICEDEPRNCVLNCGHIFCRNCAEREIYCFVCRRPITDRRKVYM